MYAMRVVLVRLSAMGDIIHTWPLALALKEARPDLHLSWVVEDSFGPMVEGHPAVDAVIPVTTKQWRRRPLARRTRAEISLLRGRFSELQPELALDPQGVLKSSLITRWTGAARRVGLARPWRRERLAGLAYSETIPGSASQRHVVATNLEMIRSVGGAPPAEIPAPDGGWLLDRMRDRPNPVDGEGAYAVLLPGAGQRRKLLSTETFAEVAERIARSGLRVEVAWGPGELELAERVSEGAGALVRCAPPTDLEQLALLLAGASLVVGGDTGPVHLAASFGVPTLGLYTATDWRRNGPLGSSVAVVSGVVTEDDGPAASAWASPSHEIGADEIERGIRRLLGASDP
jgi:heptosyltransferase-1